jgi:hypothetical protein
VQGLQRRFDWAPPAALWTLVSWITTMSFISLGWIFFRASSIAQASQMLSSVLSPAGYSSHFLSGSLYLLILVLAASYAIVLMAIETLNRYSVEPEASESKSRRGILWFIARNRWFWIPPLYSLALLFILVVTLTHGENAAQFMYRGF